MFFFFNFKNFNCIICVYICAWRSEFDSKPWSLFVNVGCLQSVCWVWFGNCFKWKLTLCELVLFTLFCLAQAESLYELSEKLDGEQLKKDWFLCSIKEGVLGHLQCSARYFSFCVIWPYESCHFFGYVLLIAYVFFFFLEGFVANLATFVSVCLFWILGLV